jgi:hypothetical protein
VAIFGNKTSYYILHVFNCIFFILVKVKPACRDHPPASRTSGLSKDAYTLDIHVYICFISGRLRNTKIDLEETKSYNNRQDQTVYCQDNSKHLRFCCFRWLTLFDLLYKWSNVKWRFLEIKHLTIYYMYLIVFFLS